MKFLRLFLKEEYLEEIEGDMEEIFTDNLENYSPRKARMIFTWDAIRLIHPLLIKNFEINKIFNSSGMIRNNVKVSLRVFSRNKSYTFINVLGMSTGLAIAILILLYVRFELSYEKSNPLADRIVRISMDYYNGESIIDQDAEMYSPAGPRMASELSEVASFARVSPLSEATIKVGDDFFRETKMYAVDSTFFELFNYPLVYGNPKNIFATPFELALTESQALKYFNRSDVVGESLWISKFNRLFKITGIIEDNPLNTHFKFNTLISYATVKDDAVKQGWNNNETYTYLLLSDNIQYNKFLTSLNTFNDRLHKENKILTERIIAQPIKDIHLHSHKPYEMEQNGDATSVFFLFGVAILVITIAVVNYINLSTAKSLDRAKEVGIRKVVGSTLNQLRTQFFTESLLINFISGLLAAGLMFLFLPAFRNLAGLPQTFHFWNDNLFWLSFIAVLLLSTVLSGIFPAFILSSFQPISVLKGKFSRSSRGLMLRKGLVIFQFSMTMLLLIQMFTAERQLNYMRSIDLGLNAEHIIVVRSPSDSSLRSKYRVFKDELLTYPQFQSLTISSSVPGQSSGELGSTNSVNLVGALEKQSFNFYAYWIDPDFIPTMQMELNAGENFIPESPNDDKIIVNEETIKLLGIANPHGAIGKKIEFWGGEKRTIIGVIKNFHQGSAKSSYLPMFFLAANKENSEWSSRLVSIRAQSGDLKGDLSTVKKVYESVFPSSPFDYFFLDQEFDKQYRAEEQFQNVFGTLTGFAILISCLGLFGLVSFTVTNRTKEIGVRKVLGASISQIVALLSKDFILLILISMIISISATYFLIQSWLSRYAFRIDLSFWLFAIPAVGVLAISLLTIFLKTFQVSSANPVNSLKEE